MFELFLLLLLVTLVVLVIRPRKSLDNPLVIRREGQYHITMAPQLKYAQTFIERIADEAIKVAAPQGELPSLFYVVRDPGRVAQEAGVYLLAVSRRGGLWYLQAICPRPVLHDADSHLKQIREFSDAVLADHPLGHAVRDDELTVVRNLVETVARQSNITVKMLADGE